MKNQTKKLREFLAGISFPEYSIISVFAIITGAVVGFSVVLFHKCIDWATDLFFHFGLNQLSFLDWTAVILIPAIGMLLQALMRKADPETARRKGVTDVIKAVAIRGGYIPFKTTLFHFFAPIISIGSGATVGPEGPAAQLGGGVASKLSRVLGIKDSRRKMFTAAGSGAAISAVFNTPLGGIFFALEIILLNDFHSPTFSALILASVTASAISRIFLGDDPAFIFQTTEFQNYEYLYIFIIIGIVSGLVSLAFIKYSDSSGNFINEKVLPKIPRMYLMVLIGLLVGIAGYFYSDIFGIGYGFINKTLSGNIDWDIVLILIALKFILVPLILNSGGFGGIFAPSLFIGAGFGFLLSAFVNSVWGIDIPATTIILVSMGAMLGGINSIPISSILIIFEMTKDYSFILPLMLATVVSTIIVQTVLKSSVHVKHLEHQGYKISEGREKNILRSISVKQVLNNEIEVISENTPLPKLMSDLLDSPNNTLYIKNSNGKLTGTISENELRPIITEYEHLRTMLVAGDIASQKVIKVGINSTLDHVMNKFTKENVDEFVVVNDSNSDEILGTIKRQDILTAYNKESLKYNLAHGLSRELKNINEFSSKSHVTDGYFIAEIRVPNVFIGQSLAEIKIRNNYHLEVLMVKQSPAKGNKEKSSVITPHPDYKFVEGDSFVLFGPEESIAKIKNWKA